MMDCNSVLKLEMRIVGRLVRGAAGSSYRGERKRREEKRRGEEEMERLTAHGMFTSHWHEYVGDICQLELCPIAGGYEE